MEGKTTTLFAVLCALACINVATSSDEDVYYKCFRSKHAMKNFDLEKWAGHWYYATASGIGYTKCNQEFITPLPEGGFNVTIGAAYRKQDGTYYKYYGDGVAKDASFANEAIFNNTLNRYFPPRLENNYGEPIYILDTDNTNYAVEYSCRTREGEDQHGYTILSRTPQLAEQFQRKAAEALLAQGVNMVDAMAVVQDCGNIFEQK